MKTLKNWKSRYRCKQHRSRIVGFVFKDKDGNLILSDGIIRSKNKRKL